ncbi:MAG TPA: GNAT family N-acetyltransferase [Micromonosporaceae bacterium]|nr:GNAT family N-acetyltransferase [Micromonosporaceae bacterium]
MTSVRPAVVDDVPAIAAVHVRTWQTAYEGLLPQTVLDGLDVAERAAMWRNAIEHPSLPGAIFVAESDGMVVGFVAVGIYRAPGGERDPSAAQVFAIYVTPDRWSIGAGMGLMHAAIEHLAGHGFAEVRLWVFADNPRARRFYERCGFVADGETLVEDVGGRPVEEVRYTLHVR